MQVIKHHRPLRVTATAYVIVSETFGKSRDEIVDFALRAAGESRRSIFGYSVSTTCDGNTRVDYYRD